jgi:hypothetical protein
MVPALDGEAVFRASLRERQFSAAVGASHPGWRLTDVPADAAAIARLVERFQAELERRGVHSRHDLRIVVTCLAAATAWYALLGDYIRHGARLDGPAR